MKNGFFSLCCLLTITTSTVAERPEQVGRFQSFANFEFRGNEAFTATMLQKELQKSPTLFAFGRERRPLIDLMRATEQELVRGYQSNGFPNPDIEVSWNEDLQRPLVMIQEGPRFLRGEVRIEGVHEEVVSSIRHWLTEKTPPLDAVPFMEGKKQLWRDKSGKLVGLEKPKWNDTTYCSFLPFILKLLEPYVQRAIEDHGYLNPEFRLSLEQDLASKRVHLNIDVVSIGEAMTIDEIKITGLERHTREEILDFLKIEIGHAITPTDVLKWQQQLTACGRFQWHNVYIDEKLFPTQPTEICIDLLECEEMPMLAEEFSADQISQLKLVEWFNRFEEQDVDILFEEQGLIDAFIRQIPEAPSVNQMTICSSPTGALLVSIDIEDRLAGGEETIVAVMTPEATELVLKKRRLIYRGTAQPITPVVTMRFFGTPPPAEGRHSSTRFGIGINSGGKTWSDISVSPFFGLYNFKEMSKLPLAENSELSGYSSKFGHLKFHQETGQLKELLFQQSHQIPNKSDEKVSIKVTAETRLLEKLRQESMQFQGAKPVVHENIVEFVAANLPDDLREKPQVISGVSLVIRVLDRLQQEKPNQQAKEDKFTIPPDFSVGTSTTAILALGTTNFLLAENTQIWKLARELVAVQVLKDPLAVPELLRILQDPQNGPIMNWVFAEILAHVPLFPAENLAERGLEQIDGDQYLADLQQLLNPNGKVGEFLSYLAMETRCLPADELDVLLSILPKAQRKEILQQQADTTCSEADFALLLIQQLWHTCGMKTQLQQRLTLLSEDAAGNKLMLQIDR